MIGGLLPVRDRHFFDAATAPVYGVIALMALMVVSAVASGLFNYSVPLARDTGLAVLIFLVLAWLARWIGFQLIAASTEAVILFLLIAFLAPCCAVIMAATNLPLADGTLSSIDSLIGFDRTTVIPPVNAIPWINRASVWVYNSFTVQPFLLLLLLIATRRSGRAWTLLTAWGIALIISLVVFAFVPAFGTPPYVLDFVDVLRGARDGSLRTLDESALTGIITFPSFHAAGATLLAWGFASFGRIAAPLVLLNVAVIASALISGGHYLVDLPAGMLVAGIAIRLAQSVHRQSDDHVAEGRLTACL